MMKKSYKRMVAVVLSAVALTGCGNNSATAPATTAAENKETVASDASVTLKVATGSATSYLVMLDKFKEEVEERTGGEVAIEIYKDLQLGTEAEVIEGCIMGNVDIITSDVGPLANYCSDFYLFSVPFLFSNREEAYATLDGEVGEKLKESMAEKGLTSLGFPENGGFRNLTTTKVEVHKPEDMNGLKLRVMENEIHIDLWRAVGANPTPLSWAELYTALQQGAVEGQDNSVEVSYTSGMTEIQNYMIGTNHLYAPLLFAINSDKFHSLTDEQQKTIMEVAKECVDYDRELCLQYEEEYLKKMEEEGFCQYVTLSEDELAQFRAKVTDVADKVKEKMEHPELVDMTEAELRK